LPLLFFQDAEICVKNGMCFAVPHFLGGIMALLDSQKQSRQSRAGIIRKIFNFISDVVPHHQSKAASETPARSSSTEAKAKAPAKRSKHHKRASENRGHAHAQAHAKTKRHSASASKAKSAAASSAHRKPKKQAVPQTERIQHNPKDVIPEQPHDPAHSPGHRRMHIEKELH
jgi:hypothetical protein